MFSLYQQLGKKNFNFFKKINRYWVFSLFYFLFERKYLKDIFYCGYSKSFLDKFSKGENKFSMVKISSDVKDYSNNYYIWFDLEMPDGKVVRIIIFMLIFRLLLRRILFLLKKFVM